MLRGLGRHRTPAGAFTRRQNGCSIRCRHEQALDLRAGWRRASAPAAGAARVLPGALGETRPAGGFPCGEARGACSAAPFDLATVTALGSPASHRRPRSSRLHSNARREGVLGRAARRPAPRPTGPGYRSPAPTVMSSPNEVRRKAYSPPKVITLVVRVSPRAARAAAPVRDVAAPGAVPAFFCHVTGQSTLPIEGRSSLSSETVYRPARFRRPSLTWGVPRFP